MQAEWVCLRYDFTKKRNFSALFIKKLNKKLNISKQHYYLLELTMTTAEKLEKVLEYVVNDEQTKASDLLHEVFVEKAKNIYENILDDEQPVEENLEEQPDEDDPEALQDEIEQEEVSLGEEDDDMDVAIEPEGELDPEMVDAEEDMEDDLGISDDEGGDEEPSEDLEDEVMDLKAQLADLQAEFEKLQSGDDAEEEMEPEIEDIEEPEVEETIGEPEAEEIYDDLGESHDMKKANDNPNDPVGEDSGSSGSPVAKKGGSDPKASGASSSGGTSNPDGTSAPSSPSAKEDNAGNRNVPGGSAGKQSKVAAPKKGE